MGLPVPSNVEKYDGPVETLNSGGERLKNFLQMWLKFQTQEEEAETCPYISSYSEKYELKQEAQLLLLGAAATISSCVCWIYFLRIIKSGKCGFITVRSSRANLLIFLECNTESHSLSMYFTPRKGFNNLSAAFFVWVKSNGKRVWVDLMNYNLSWA